MSKNNDSCQAVPQALKWLQTDSLLLLLGSLRQNEGKFGSI